MRMCAVLLVTALICVALPASAAVELIKGGRTDYSIVIAKNASLSEHWAASELKSFMNQMSGIILPYAPDSTDVPEKAILVGNSQALDSLGLDIDFKDLGEEGFTIKTVGSRIVIAGGRERGTMYGVYTFLEMLGCRFLSADVNKVPKRTDIVLENIDTTQKPAYEYRRIGICEADDPIFSARLRCPTKQPDAKYGGGITYFPFVHSFYSLVPRDIYWDSHPEYYSLIDGKRQKHPTQLCLTNPEVLDIAKKTVLEWMRDHPDADIISVSQNDNMSSCQCPKCRAIEQEEGSPAGLMLRFVNAVAEETEKYYPDKLIDTLAYGWTVHPPKITKPRANVRVRLCPIECCETHPYEQCNFKANISFLEDLKGWAKLTDKLYIWHYNTDFSNYQMPFPDFRELMDSAKLYRKNGVKGIFWQGAYNCGHSELGELRAYLLSKISWNPDVDGEAIIKEFCDDFYGSSGKYIYQYITLLEDKVADENIHMQICEKPTCPCFSPDIIAKSDRLFAKAMSVADSHDILYRVKQAYLPIKYVKLMQPILRKETDGKEAEYEKRIDEFLDECESYGITRIKEGLTVDKARESFKKMLYK
ncbi:DUF4838 domain-containing protein [bacterium]|nr:DUF4838 domain-containing protein [bacterium]